MHHHKMQKLTIPKFQPGKIVALNFDFWEEFPSSFDGQELNRTLRKEVEVGLKLWDMQFSVQCCAKENFQANF